jgi:hypothetical protein
MTAMVQEFDGVRELSVEEVDAVSGAGIGDAIGDFIEAANDLWDEVPPEVQAVGVVAAGMMVGAAVGGPAGAVAGGTIAAVGVLTTGT